jgi:acetyl-CoA carboxylase carboxyltransferase component
LNKKLKELEKPEFAEKQHQKGKLTARERINLLLDPEALLNWILLLKAGLSI